MVAFFCQLIQYTPEVAVRLVVVAPTKELPGKMKLLLLLFLAQNSLQVSGFVNQVCSRKVLRTASVTCLRDALEPLAEEGSWQAFLDEETTGLIYYFDSETGESLWEPPTASFPKVRLNRKKQRLADDLRRKYRKSREIEEETEDVTMVEEKEETNWIVGLFDDDKAVADEAELEIEAEESNSDPTQPKQNDWFNNIFGETKVISEEEVVEEAQEKKPRGILDSFVGFRPETDEEMDVDITPTPLKIDVGSFVLPHPAKVRWGGEDAVFTKGRTFGVFDGVSGAEKLDGVPLYSKTLANEMKRAVGFEAVSITEMTSFLQDAADLADRTATGASTAVVASIGENGFLQALNLGDSYCVVVRGGRISAKTREISHYWECPYQLSEDSPDRAKDGTKLNIELIAGDMVVMGSDGIFDNVDDDMLLDLIDKNPRRPGVLAKKICELSRKQSLDRNSLTPYAKQAQRRGDPDYKEGVGGKVDDSSCIVVLCK